MRRATGHRDLEQHGQGFSIHALREEGDAVPDDIDAVLDNLSIHALREEGDTTPPQVRKVFPKFLSTPSVRRATLIVCIHNSVLYTFLSTPSVRRATFQ